MFVATEAQTKYSLICFVIILYMSNAREPRQKETNIFSLLSIILILASKTMCVLSFFSSFVQLGDISFCIYTIAIFIFRFIRIRFNFIEIDDMSLISNKRDRVRTKNTHTNE